MKLTKKKRDIIEAIQAHTEKVKKESLEIEAKAKAVVPLAFADAVKGSAYLKKKAEDNLKDAEARRKELEKDTVERTTHKLPTSDALKKMKLVEDFVNESFKDKLTINENVYTVTDLSRNDLIKLMENARVNKIKYSINKLEERYEFKYLFERVATEHSLDESTDLTEKKRTLSKGEQIAKAIMRILEEKDLDEAVYVENNVITEMGFNNTDFIFKNDGSVKVDWSNWSKSDFKDMDTTLKWARENSNFKTVEDFLGSDISLVIGVLSSAREEILKVVSEILAGTYVIPEEDLSESKKLKEAYGDMASATMTDGTQVMASASDSSTRIYNYEHVTFKWKKGTGTGKYRWQNRPYQVFDYSSALKEAMIEAKVPEAFAKEVIEKSRSLQQAIEYFAEHYSEEKITESKKALKESNDLQNSPYKELIGSHFNHTFDFDFLDIVAETLNRIDFDVAYNFEDEVESAVQDALIYTNSQWVVAQFYASSPAELDWDEVFSEFEDDIKALADEIKEEHDIDDDLEESKTKELKAVDVLRKGKKAIVEEPMIDKNLGEDFPTEQNLKDIEELKGKLKDLKGLTLQEIAKKFDGHNEDGHLFDFNFKSLAATFVEDDKGIYLSSIFDLHDGDDYVNSVSLGENIYINDLKESKEETKKLREAIEVGNTFLFNKEEAWSGSVDLTTGEIKEVHSFEEAEEADFHAEFYFSDEHLSGVENGERAFFCIYDDGEIFIEGGHHELAERIAEQVEKLSTSLITKQKLDTNFDDEF